ncbi:type VI secretion system Vgr family protein [Muricoccus radiodurans]|uniref:type VI secretion system Vgr family protein n=1 Tax=Muricoccus radiodurans TaxID=2231721 RepID=UPI003CF602F5
MSDSNVISQTSRMLRITSPLGPDVLVLRRITVREAIGGLYRIEAEVLSDTTNLDPEALIGKPITCTVESTLRGTRHYHGIVNTFVRIGEDGRGHATYRLEAVPRLWFLSRRVNCRIFQKEKPQDIITKLVTEDGAGTIAFGNGTEAPPREYCTQFNESDLDFILRLMEEHGWALFFQHEQNDHKAHVVSINASFPLLPSTQTVRRDMVGAGVTALTRWEPRSTLPPGSAKAWDHDQLGKFTNLKQSSADTILHTAHKAHAEVFRWPGGQTVRPGADPAKLMMEGPEAGADRVGAAGTDPSLYAGSRVKVKSGIDGTVSNWLVTEITHQGFDDTHLDGGGTAGYSNSFVVIPAERPWRPLFPRPRPVMGGVHHALVTGPKGEEIHCDEYGRIKVLFPWFRGGRFAEGGAEILGGGTPPSPGNENSSCWVRVMQASSGAWGGNWYLPRIGDQVIVAFVDSDPDRPLVMGAVYGDTFKPPFPLPAKKTQTGYKTRSTKNGAASNFNQIMFDDEKGKELVDMQAEKDLHLLVKNNRTVEVNNNHTETIGNNRTATIKKGNETLTVETGNMTTTVKKGNQENTVEMGNQTNTVKMGNQTNEVSMGNQTNTVKMGNITEKANLGKIDIEAMQSITLKVGGSSIEISQIGVTIKGAVMVDVKGVMVQQSADAIMTIKGGLVMIN